MYERYWLLKERPFDGFRDSRFHCRLPGQYAVTEKLRYALVDRSGCALLTGLPGVGKTALARDFVHRHGARFTHIAWLGQPYFGHQELLRQLYLQLTADQPAASDSLVLEHPGLLLEKIQYLFQTMANHVLIVLDNIQELSDPAAIGALKAMHEWGELSPSPLDAVSRRAPRAGNDQGFRVSLLLMGLPVASQTLRQFAGFFESLALRLSLPCLSREELSDYLRQRMQAAEAQQECFTEEARDQLHRLAGGIPRKINQLADLSLLVGYVRKKSIVAAEEVLQAARELMLLEAA